tara:strand:- start:154 stop:387 length:234 start_codon:yes stop_codon:yes gene_type:complete
VVALELELDLVLVVMEVLVVEDLIRLLDVVEQQILPHNQVIKEMLEELVLGLHQVTLAAVAVELVVLVLQEPYRVLV